VNRLPRVLALPATSRVCVKFCGVEPVGRLATALSNVQRLAAKTLGRPHRPRALLALGIRQFAF
jgi:hypothetical protein